MIIMIYVPYACCKLLFNKTFNAIILINNYIIKRFNF